MLPVLMLFILSGFDRAQNLFTRTPLIHASVDIDTPAQTTMEQTPIMKMDDILSVGLYGNPLRHEKPRMLHMEDTKDKMVINIIVQLLNRSEKVEKPIYHGRHGYPPSIQFQLSNGDTVKIEPAVDCVTTKVLNGSETQCSPAKDELFLHNGSIETRLASPVLYDWLRVEFKGEIHGFSKA
jgi:hypothetical protein